MSVYLYVCLYVSNRPIDDDSLTRQFGCGQRITSTRRQGGKKVGLSVTATQFGGTGNSLALSDHCVRIENSPCGSVKPVHSDIPEPVAALNISLVEE